MSTESKGIHLPAHVMAEGRGGVILEQVVVIAAFSFLSFLLVVNAEAHLEISSSRPFKGSSLEAQLKPLKF